MADKDKKQVTAMRLEDSTIKKFKEIAEDLGANQQQTLARLIEAYETEMGKERFPEQRENIDTFEGYIRSAANMYLQAIESVQNMRALVRTEYSAELKSKDKTIIELQERLEKSDRAAKEALDKESEYQLEIKKILEDMHFMEKELHEERAKQKACRNDYAELSETYAKLQEAETKTKNILSKFMEENQELKSENNKLLSERSEFDSKMQNVSRKNEELLLTIEREKQNTLEEVKKQEEKFEDYKKRLQLEHQLEMQVKMNELQNAHKAELDEIRKELDKYKDLYYRPKQQEIVTDRQVISYSHHTGESV